MYPKFFNYLYINVNININVENLYIYGVYYHLLYYTTINCKNIIFSYNVNGRFIIIFQVILYIITLINNKSKGTYIIVKITINFVNIFFLLYC